MTEGRSVSRACTAVALLAVLLQLAPAAGLQLELSRPALFSGQLWRLVTGHLVHWTWDHLLWDLLTFMVAVRICAARAPALLVRCLIASALAVPATVLALAPEIEVYRGLSGVDAAAYVLAGLLLVEERRAEGDRAGARVVVALLVAFLAKLAYELATGGAVFMDSATAGVVTVPVGHLAGALVGWWVWIGTLLDSGGSSVRSAPAGACSGPRRCGGEAARGGRRGPASSIGRSRRDPASPHDSGSRPAAAP